MRTLILSLAAVAALAGASQAQAAGCASGAVVGGLAGHVVGHGVLGAAAGCAVGHHEAKKAKQQKMQTNDRGAPSQGQTQAE